MAAEIELKAHIVDVDKTLSIIRNTLGISQECFQEKKDVYFTKEIDKPPLRCRLERKGSDRENLKESVLITLKNKELQGEIEENNEIEIECGSQYFETSLTLFRSLGYKETLFKEKTGYSFMLDKYKLPLHVELLEIKPLGWFLEMEFTSSDKLSKEDVNILKSSLLDALSLFSVAHSQIERQYYRDLLNLARLKEKGI
jgi:adenylate cyclase class 2